MGRGDDQHFANICQHQGGERVVNHRFVVDRQQLLADRLSDWMEPRAAASGCSDAAFL